MLEKYNNINLIFTDTDSLLYEIETEDIYADMIKDKDNYDFSDYPESHHCFQGMTAAEITHTRLVNKKALGKFKDELKGFPLQETIGNRPKCYSLKYLTRKSASEELSEEEKQIAKGVNTAVKKALLRHYMYKDTVENLATYMVEQNQIKSKAHQLGTYHQTKIALSAFDTKRWICDDGIKTRAYGHKDNC